VNDSFTTGMPQVLFQTNDIQVGSKFFNPIVDKGNIGYNPIGTIPPVPPIINPPIDKVLSEPSQLIKPLQNFPQPVKIAVGLSLGILCWRRNCLFCCECGIFVMMSQWTCCALL
jgi:hypothetical protein